MCAIALDRVKDNLRAIGKHIEALKGIERWGVSSVEEAFEPFLLPTASPTYQDNGRNGNNLSWWTILNANPTATVEEIKVAYRALSLKHHSDAGGDCLWQRQSRSQFLGEAIESL